MTPEQDGIDESPEIYIAKSYLTTPKKRAV
jgi:hypothetical protein